jgi:hypothetical protein
MHGNKIGNKNTAAHTKILIKKLHTPSFLRERKRCFKKTKCWIIKRGEKGEQKKYNN